MAQFRKDKKSGNWVVLASSAEADLAKNTTGNCIAVETKSGKVQWKHITRWSRLFQTEEGMACYGYPCDLDRPKDDESEYKPEYRVSNEPF